MSKAMTKEEIEKAIENGETVRFVDKYGEPALPYKEFLEKQMFIINNELMLFVFNNDITLVDFSDKALENFKSVIVYDKTEQNYNLALEELYKRWSESL